MYIGCICIIIVLILFYLALYLISYIPNINKNSLVKAVRKFPDNNRISFKYS